MMRGALLFLVLWMLSGCGDDAPQREEFYAMGTVINLSFYGVTPERSKQLSEQVQQEFKRLHAQWQPWQNGELADINRALAAGQAASVSPAIQQLIEQSAVLSDRSDGLFNPAIGSLVKLWGFHQDVRGDVPPPSLESIQLLLQQNLSMHQLHLQGDQLRSDNPALQLDFGGFAKGVAVDAAIAKLRAAGVKDAIVNAGGDLRAIGSKGKQAWTIGVRDPRSPGVLASIAVRGDESVVTSGDYERFFEYQGQRYHHILDPRSGYPAKGLTSVTVMYPQASVADAAATALLVAGPNDWLRIAKQLGLQQVMVIDSQGRIFLTPAMQSRVEFVNAKTAVTVVSL
ncbi:MAG: FAD:protein FMN transferase [Gammaproteobacteria bacterium]|nr:FAD:protein FMN transferase [Gammaproteobacteria bacterium]